MRHRMQLRSVPAVAVGSHRACPDRAILRSGPAHHVAGKARQLLGMRDRIDDQL